MVHEAEQSWCHSVKSDGARGSGLGTRVGTREGPAARATFSTLPKGGRNRRSALGSAAAGDDNTAGEGGEIEHGAAIAVDAANRFLATSGDLAALRFQLDIRAHRAAERRRLELESRAAGHRNLDAARM